MSDGQFVERGTLDLWADTARDQSDRIKELEAKLANWQAQQHYTYIGRDGKAVLARDLEDRAEAAEAMAEKLAEALSLADASLSGANMDMKHVWRKIKSALAAYQAHKGAK